MYYANSEEQIKYYIKRGYIDIDDHAKFKY